jgi:type II secretory ATPase GspE/PulE/Tfp pilus assembly ATPase PilB-like protein
VATPKPIDELGFDAEEVATLKRLMSRPHGLFLVCGPTGSGKTTTLHSLLAHLSTDLKIWTAEDPIEITQAGLRQVQVNPKIGWTFAAAMKTFMRADPDVIMVGEMRDAETTRIVIEASLTGHLVLSTLHTNSATESVVRLLDLGMDPFNFADALLGVLAQRLVRRLCLHCRVKHEPDAREFEALAAEYCEGTPLEPQAVLGAWRERQPTLYRPKGCKECDRTGYQGRLAIYELMVADAAVKRLVQRRAPVSEITTAALAGGMRTLKQDGITKVLRGHTDMREVRAV